LPPRQNIARTMSRKMTRSLTPPIAEPLLVGNQDSVDR
jgi:hypothetical protein